MQTKENIQYNCLFVCRQKKIYSIDLAYLGKLKCQNRQSFNVHVILYRGLVAYDILY
jgi:hypothetical protein